MNDLTLDFVGIGAAKAGTTWLAACLGEHPQICLSIPKELNYFCSRHIWLPSPTYYGEGQAWLRARFSHWRAGQIKGEISPSYLVDPESPALIREHSPNAKLIVSYRNPTDGLYSLYHELGKRYRVPRTFEAFLEEYPRAIDYGCYHRHTERFLRHFPIERFHFIVFDDICSDAQGVLAELFEFLGVDSSYNPPSLGARVNEREFPRSRLVRNLVGGTVDFFRTFPGARGLKPFLRLLGGHHVADWLWARNLQAAGSPSMSEDTRLRLLELYAEENARLGELLDRDLDHWNE